MGYLIDTNAKNVWVRDHADTEDLSVQTSASSVYFNNGRTMEQEFGKGAMSSNVVTVDSGMEKVIDGTYDGAYESCKMYGKSLVNVMTKEIDTTWNLNLTNWSIVFTNPSDFIFKPNTTYSVIVYVTEKTCSDRDDLFWVGDIDGSKNKITHDIVRKNVSLGTNVFVINTVSDFSNLSSTKGGIGFQGSKFVEGTLKWKAIVLEGDWTDKELPPYFTGLCDVKAPTLKNVGKNILRIMDYDKLRLGATVITQTENSVTWQNPNSWGGLQYYLYLKPHTTYSYIFDRESTDVRSYIRYLENGGYSGGYGGSNQYTFTTREDGHVMFTIECATSQNSVTASNLVFVEGDTIPTYEDYKTNILETSNDVVLRGLPNGIKDSYDCLTGEYVRRVGEIVLNGSEDWAFQNGTWVAINNTLMFKHGVVTMKGLTQQENNSNRELLCDKQKVFSSNSLWNTGEEGIFKGMETRDIRLRVLKSHLSTEDVNGLKLYLQANPITIQYELAEPIVTTIEPSTTPFAYENGHIILESGHEGQSLLPTLEYQTVVSRSGQVAMIDKTIQQHERKITLLEKMLVQNIIDIEYKNTLLALKLEIDEVI